MAFGLSTKNVCSVTIIVYFIFLLTIVSLITHHSSTRQRLYDQNRLTNQDHNRPKIPINITNLDKSARFTCDRSHFRYDICSINGLAILDPTKATLYSIGSFGSHSSLEKVKPYPRKLEEKIMESIREVTLISGPKGPKCKIQHNSPAVVFSVGGLTGNFYHAFTDGFLPLYITLNNLNFTDRDVILVVEQAHEWWAHKYAELIRAFTKYPIINLEKDTSTHCFTRVVVGLVTHGIMSVDPKALPGPLTLSGFHSFLRNTYSQGSLGTKHPKGHRPKLVWVARTGQVGRVILNQDKARTLAEEIGFDVVIYNPMDKFLLRDAYELIDGSHAMIGVHGAGMTHLLFLRPGSVVVQIAPLGLEWVGDKFFGQASRELGMEYMEYKVGYNESTLASKYEKDDPILKDAKEFLLEKGWALDIMNVYLKEQNVKLDLVMFRSYMKKVYEKAKRFMELYG